MSEPVVIPGTRSVRGRLDTPDATDVVVACPPHPQLGGSRRDRRLRAVSEALAPDVACLRFDYGPWDKGEGEQGDAVNALAWAEERYDDVWLFGYSFGAAVALCAAAVADAEPAALSVLAPPAGLVADRDVVAALDGIDCPVQIVYGERDDAVDWEPVIERAEELGCTVEGVPAGHRFHGRVDRIGTLVASFFGENW